jgi:HAD superfamily hydrolase (TIGR01509 family)
MQVDGILFDFGGTLDGDGLHWLDRFYALYLQLGFSSPREAIRAAFDFAEAEALRDSAMQTAGLGEMVKRHVRWQFAKLEIDDPEARHALGEKFVENVRVGANANAALLQDLAQRGLRLGVISNGCGNTDVLCNELDYARYLSVVLDSKHVGLSKPDPQFFKRAAEAMELPPERLLMVGDSLERDIRPAKEIGMQTAWLNPNRSISDSAADVQLTRLAELRELLRVSSV